MSAPHTLLNKLGALCGLLSLLSFFIGLPGAGFLSVLDASLTADELVAHYHSHQAGIQAMAIYMNFNGITWTLFIGVLCGQLARIPSLPKTIIYALIGTGTVAAVICVLPGYFLLLACYRLDRAPEITVLLHDFAITLMLASCSASTEQQLLISYAMLQDKRSKPLFPHWVAYLTGGMSTLYWLGSVAAPTVKTGAFAMDGLVGLWLSKIMLVVPILMTSWHLYLATCRTDLPADDQNSVGEIYSTDRKVQLS